MKEYHKIQSVFKRNEKTGKFLDGQWSLPEFEYLAGNDWIGTEKVDGTNVRVIWDGQQVRFGGKTDSAQMPVFLLDRLRDLFPADRFSGAFDCPACLYGEGYGARIQKGGGNYIPKGVDFILFDVRVGEWWLKPEDVADVAGKLGIRRVPIVFRGPLTDAIRLVAADMESTFGHFCMEGMVLTTAIPLMTRNGQRIITKVKTRDFARQGDGTPEGTT